MKMKKRNILIVKRRLKKVSGKRVDACKDCHTRVGNS